MAAAYDDPPDFDYDPPDFDEEDALDSGGLTPSEEEWIEREQLRCIEQEEKHWQATLEQTQRKNYTRGLIRSGCEDLHQEYLASGNPLYALDVIMMCTAPVVAPMLLPDWCIPVLHDMTARLLRVRGDGDTLNTSIAKALGLTRRGWTAYKAKASDQRAQAAALLYDKLRQQGLKSSAAHEQVREALSLGDAGAAAKLVRSGRAIIESRRRRPAEVQAAAHVTLKACLETS